VLNGVVDRYPGARIILAHAGGALRLASLCRARERLPARCRKAG
jgi:hypothetical protein